MVIVPKETPVSMASGNIERSLSGVKSVAKSMSVGMYPIEASRTAPPTIQAPPPLSAILFNTSTNSVGNSSTNLVILSVKGVPLTSDSLPRISCVNLISNPYGNCQSIILEILFPVSCGLKMMLS